jgi:hypothetical protein
MENEQNELVKAEVVNEVVKEEVVDNIAPEVKKQKDRLDDLFMLMRESTGYMVNFSILRNNKLNHYAIVSDFPELDILRSIKEYEKLAVERLKNI